MDKDKKEDIRIVCDIILALTAMVAIFVSISTAQSSNKLAERVIELTPSKFAEINVSLLDYSGDSIPLFLSGFKTQ
ncbi:MAG: hypothetical protein AABX99_03415 [Nanoarchaeota archaeon]